MRNFLCHWIQMLSFFHQRVGIFAKEYFKGCRKVYLPIDAFCFSYEANILQKLCARAALPVLLMYP